MRIFETAGDLTSVEYRFVKRRFVCNAVFLFCMLFCILFFHHTAFAMPELFSSGFQLRSNTAKEIQLEWNFENPLEKTEHAVLLFAHGPVSAATFSIDSYTWKQTKHGNITATGHETDLPQEFSTRIPKVQLQEFGLLAGCRVAVLKLRVQQQTHLQTSGKDLIEFPQGVIRIVFRKQDEEPFTGFSTALDEAAKRLYINYPPLQSTPNIEITQNEFPYIQNPAIKLLTRDSGLYALQGREVLQALRENNLTVDHIAAFQQQKPVPCVVLDQDGNHKKTGNLNANDQVLFYAESSQSSFSRDVVTWMTANHNAAVKPSPLEATIAPAETDTLYRKNHLEMDVFHIDGRKRNEEQNKHWMWHDFEDGDFATDFNIQDTIHPATGIIQVNFDIQNNSFPMKPVHLNVLLNQQVISGTVSNIEVNKFQFEAHVSSNTFKKNNTMVVSVTEVFQQNNPTLLDSITVFYPTKPSHSTQAFFNPLQKPSIQIPEHTKQIWAVTSNHENQFVSLPTHQKSILGSNLESVFFLPANPTLPSATIETALPKHQRSIAIEPNHQSEVILISPRQWRDILSPYQAKLQQQSLTSTFVAAEDVYDLFGDGTMSPFAIRRFLRYAYQHWQNPKPSYVVLTGDATWDYWGRFHNGIVNNLPAYQGDRNYAIENWYVRCDDPDDPLPDMVVSRIPVRTGDELRTVIDKTLAFRDNPPISDWLNKMLVLTDDEFEDYTDELTDKWIPQGFQLTDRHVADYLLVDNIYLPAAARAKMRAKTSLEATEDIIQRLNDGVLIWEFFGHGAPNVMGNQRLFFGGGSKFSDVKKLAANAKPSVIWSFSCETTRFDYAEEKWNISIGEDLLTLPNGGAVALMGAAGRGFPQDHIILARALHTTAFDYGISTFGLQYFTAQMMSLAMKNSFEPIDQFAILGDPALPMPQFVELQGSITDTGSHYHVVFDADERFAKPLDGGNWIQNHDGTNYEILEKEYTSGSFPQKSSISKQYAQNFPNGKIGVYMITKEHNRLFVGHGAIPFPQAEVSSEFIEPTTGKLPDLSFVPNSLTMRPTSPRSGESVLFEADIVNKGKASAQKFSVQGFTVSGQDEELPFDIVVGQRYAKIDFLHPGEQETIRLRWDPTDNAGEHTIRFKVDSQSRVLESNEENNSMDTTLTVKKKSDLALHEKNVTLTKTPDGRMFILSFKVVNEGESTAERVVIALHVTINGQVQTLTLPLDPSKRPARVVKPTSIAPQGVFSANDLKLPSSIESLEIIVDPDEIVDEESHENNSYLFQPNTN